MRAVDKLDVRRCNQIIVVLAPLVIAELALRQQYSNRLACLTKFAVRLGVEFQLVWTKLCSMTDAHIATYEPLYPKGNVQLEFKRMLRSPPLKLQKWAERTKSRNRNTLKDISDKIRDANKKARDSKSIGVPVNHVPPCHTIEEALDLTGPSIGDSLLELFSPNSTAAVRFQSGCEFFNALKWNPYAIRYFRLEQTFVFAWANSLANRDLNIRPNPNRDDISDLSLALYAGDGDIIVTNDKKLTRAVEFAEMSLPKNRRVRAMPWSECLKLLDL